MLQPVGQGINTQGILADGTNWLLYRLGQGLRWTVIIRSERVHARMSSSWTFLSNALFSQSHTHQDAQPCNDVLV
jgi:hypothetical protein